jgi:hypothetical protein
LTGEGQREATLNAQRSTLNAQLQRGETFRLEKTGGFCWSEATIAGNAHESQAKNSV